MGVNFSCFQNTCQKPSCAAEFKSCTSCSSCCCCCCSCCRCSKFCWVKQDEEEEKEKEKVNDNEKEMKKHEEKVLYRDSKMKIIILSTPQIYQPYFVPWDGMDDCEIHIVSSDETGQLRYVLMQTSAPYLFIHQKYKKDDNIDSNMMIMPHNKLVHEVIEPEYQKFLVPIYKQTLNGNHLQMVIMIGFDFPASSHPNMSGFNIRLLRSFPIWGHDAVVQAAMLVFSPHITTLGENNMNHYVLPSSSSSFASLPRLDSKEITSAAPNHITSPVHQEMPSPETRPRSNSPSQPLTYHTHDGMMPSPFRRLSHSHPFHHRSESASMPNGPNGPNVNHNIIHSFIPS